MKKVVAEPEELVGWDTIASFLGQSRSVAQRWAKSGMPVTHVGRAVRGSPADLNAWLTRGAAAPIHVVAENSDLSSELKRGLSYVKKPKKSNKKRRT